MSRRPSAKPRPPFDLTVTAARGAPFAPYLRRHLRRAHRILKPALRELSVALVGDRRMSQLHEQFMGIAGPTDVLSFPLEQDGKGRVTSGEVVICVPEARRRAKEHGVTVERELLLYALHGLLHLCGHDDRTDASFRAMHRKEDDILAQLGVGPVFAPPPTDRIKGPRKRPRHPGAARRAARASAPRRHPTGAH